MIGLLTVFWIIILIFVITSFFRSWSKELLALIAQLFSLFLLSIFAPIGYKAFNLLRGGLVLNAGQVFFGCAFVHIIFTFFAYQGGGLSEFTRKRINREEIKLQERVFSSILGAFNGYLFAGSLLSFLEYQLTDNGWTRLDLAIPNYDFGDRILRAPNHLDTTIYQNLPLRFIVEESINVPFLNPTRVLLLLLAGAFLFFLIAD